MLGPDNVRDIFDYKEGSLIWKQKISDKVVVGAVAGFLDGGKRRVSVFRSKYLVSRVVWLWYYLKWPTNDIDHIDRDPTNNKVENLRDVTRSVNLLNRSVRNKRTLEGVTARDGGFVSSIRTCEGTKYLGFFHSPEEAHKAFSEAHVRVHGVNSRYHPEHPNYEPLTY